VLNLRLYSEKPVHAYLSCVMDYAALSDRIIIE
jgi:hypothetical protein